MIQLNHPTLPTGRFIQDQLGDHDVVYQPSKDSGPWNPIIVQDHAVGDYWIIDAGQDADPGPHGPFKTQTQAWDWWCGTNGFMDYGVQNRS